MDLCPTASKLTRPPPPPRLKRPRAKKVGLWPCPAPHQRYPPAPPVLHRQMHSFKRQLTGQSWHPTPYLLLNRDKKLVSERKRDYYTGHIPPKQLDRDLKPKYTHLLTPFSTVFQALFKWCEPFFFLALDTIFFSQN